MPHFPKVLSNDDIKLRVKEWELAGYEVSDFVQMPGHREIQLESVGEPSTFGYVKREDGWWVKVPVIMDGRDIDIKEAQRIANKLEIVYALPGKDRQE